MSKAVASKRKRRAGVLLRTDPELAAWYQAVADRQARSRTNLIEQVLSAVRDVVVELDASTTEPGFDPFAAADDLGAAFVRRCIELGMGSEWVKFAVEHRAQERARLVEEVREDRKGRAGK